MNDSLPPLRRVIRLALIYSTPALIVFGALGVMGVLAPTVSAIGYVATLICAGFLALRTARDERRLETYLNGLIDDPSLRPPAVATRTLAPLSSAIARYVRHVSRWREEMRTQVATDIALLDALPDPLLVLDSTRRILRANRAAHDVLGDDLVDRDLSTAVRYPKLLQAVDNVIAGESLQEVEFEMTGGRIERHLIGHVVGLSGASDAERLIIVALSDFTFVKRSDQMRADFVANVSHELRTPLASLAGFIETLQGPARDDGAARENFLAIMEEQAARMNRLVDDLLSLSKIELSEHTPPLDAVDIDEVIAAVINAMSPQARARNVSLKWEPPDKPCRVLGDRDQLEQVFRNLIDNAIKYGSEGSSVDLRAEINAPGEGVGVGTVSISVSDQGAGIAREHLPRLTERFYRVDAGRSRELGGTGLGLAIVKHILNRHRGTLTIESDVDRGSRFTASVPLATDRDTAPLSA